LREKELRPCTALARRVPSWEASNTHASRFQNVSVPERSLLPVTSLDPQNMRFTRTRRASVAIRTEFAGNSAAGVVTGTPGRLLYKAAL
jgi:hypothetical protein